MAGTHPAQEKRGVLMNRDFDHLLADHLMARERAARGHDERDLAPRSPRSPRSARAARSGGEGLARGGRAARGGTLLRAWFR